MQKEQQLHFAFEERLGKEGSELHRDLDGASKDSRAARRVESASHGENSAEVQAATMESHKALSKEFYKYADIKQ
eukprot:9091511-Karenia_brevis.AAC.1